MTHNGMQQMYKAGCALGSMMLAMSIACAAPAPASNSQAEHMQTPQGAEPATANRKLVGEFGFRNASVDRLKKTYGYPWLYPQAFAVDTRERELFVMMGAASGKNKWGWVQVYDLDKLRLKTTFSTGQHWHEGLAIVYSGARRFLYTIGDSSLIRADITELPKELGFADVETLSVKGYSLMASDGSRFVIQDRPGANGPSGAQRFSIYDARLRKTGKLAMSLDEAKKRRSLPDQGAKMQSIAWDGRRLYAGFGGAYLPGVHRDLSEKWQGTAMFNRAGGLVVSRVADPDNMLDQLRQAIGYRPTCVENEGIAVVDGALYSLWVTLGPEEREKAAFAGKGIVLLRETVAPPTNGGDAQ